MKRLSFLCIAFLAPLCGVAQNKYFVVSLVDTGFVKAVELTTRPIPGDSSRYMFLEASDQEFSDGWAALSPSERSAKLRAGGDAAASNKLTRFIAAQNAKPNRQKAYEKKVFAYLVSEGAITTNALRLTLADLEAAYDAWDLLPGSQGDTKAAKFERMMRPLRARGETEFTIYNHPSP